MAVVAILAGAFVIASSDSEQGLHAGQIVEALGGDR